jgi:hypothetical protein
MIAFPLLALALIAAADDMPPQINPSPQTVLTETLGEWNFDAGDAEGWVAEQHCKITADAGLLKIDVTDEDPYMHRNVDVAGGQMLLSLKARSRNSGAGSVYWITRESPRRGEDKVSSFPLTHDGQWHEYSVPFFAPGHLTDVRIDPGFTAGEFEIDWIRLVRQRHHPLVVEAVQVVDRQVRFSVRNQGPSRVEFSVSGSGRAIEAGSTEPIDLPIQGSGPVEKVSLRLEVADLPRVVRTVFLHHPEAEAQWISRPLGDCVLEVSGDGLFARIRRGDELLAVLAPTVHCDGRLPALKRVERDGEIRFEGDGVTLSISSQANEVSVAISSEEPCEGPVVRALGSLEQGLLAGVEYLGKGERSSTKLDLESEEYLRFAPDPLKLTMPLMAFVTDRASIALAWNDMTLGPVFATPNFFDATDDHRMALRGTKIEATLRVDRGTLEEAILWAVNRSGLPPVPEAPRSVDQQWELCMAALEGPLRTADGWGHCVEPRWPRHPYADMASTIWRITGRMPELSELATGGSHIRNEAVYFVTDRVFEWKEFRWGQVQDLINQQKPDGSYRYAGKFARGHFEDTASGVCARPAATMLEYARITGDQRAIDAAVKTLDYMKRFRTPRGAQVWEIPLHTPDVLASAYLVWAYVRGYELTGNPSYLAEARRWALSGVPFVYLWERYPVMLYATPPVLGATNWQAPVWIGLPVQWCGLVYAYSLTMLAPHDKTLDWNHLARGILVAGEQMQFPLEDAEYAGLLPDSFALANQERRPWRINPCALVSLRLVLDGKLDFLSVAADGQHRVASPFPVRLEGGEARIQAKRDVRYQILVDGRQIIDVTSNGTDVVPLK